MTAIGSSHQLFQIGRSNHSTTNITKLDASTTEAATNIELAVVPASDIVGQDTRCSGCGAQVFEMQREWGSVARRPDVPSPSVWQCGARPDVPSRQNDMCQWRWKALLE